MPSEYESPEVPEPRFLQSLSNFASERNSHPPQRAASATEARSRTSYLRPTKLAPNAPPFPFPSFRRDLSFSSGHEAFLALCSPLPSRRPDSPSKGARLYPLRRLRPTSPRGRRARQRPPPLPQSPLRLSLAAQLPFRFRLPGHVGGGAEQTEAVEGCSWLYASSAAFPLASSALHPAVGGNCDAHVSISLQLLFALKQTQKIGRGGVVDISTNANVNFKIISFSLDRTCSQQNFPLKNIEYHIKYTKGNNNTSL